MLSLFYTPDTWLSLITLSTLEIVLGVDNLVFITLATKHLPDAARKIAWRVGLGVACMSRLLLLGAVDWLAKFNHPLFSMMQHPFSGRDLILIIGGLFLILKGLHELRQNLNTTNLLEDNQQNPRSTQKSISLTILQIVLLDLVFSLDSVMTAIAMAKSFTIMSLSIVIAVSLMLAASDLLSRLVNTYPRFKVLGLCFLLLIGAVLVLEGVHIIIARSYLYAMMGFTVLIEVIHISSKSKSTSVH